MSLSISLTMHRSYAVLLRNNVARLCYRPGSTLFIRNFTTRHSLRQSKPWYLDISENKEEDSNSPFIKPIRFPPTEIPASLETISKYLNDKLAVTDIVVFDTAHSNSATSIQSMASYVLIGTVKSFRHLQNCNDELIKFIKETFDEVPKSEGLVTSGILRKRQRRLGRKTNLGKIAKIENDESGWCLIDSNVDGLFINIMTEERRDDLNLEELYCRVEELDQYKKQINLNPPAEEEDDVLLGLRKLMMKNTKRYYSTVGESPKPTFLEALTIQDLDSASKLIKEEKKPYHVIASALGRLPNHIELDAENWIKLFNEATPTEGPLDYEYWGARFKFFQLLYISKRNNIEENTQLDASTIKEFNRELNYFINDFFRFKQLALCQPTREELIGFLEICIQHLKLSKSYNQLISVNMWILKALQSYQYSDPKVVHDPRVIKLLVKSMHTENTNLNSLYEYVNLITNEFEVRSLTNDVIKEIITTLVESENWPTLFKFWKQCLCESAVDSNVWDFFIKSLLNKNDKVILSDIVDNGHLLWIHRSKLVISDDLKASLSKLLDRVDGSHTNIKKLLKL